MLVEIEDNLIKLIKEHNKKVEVYINQLIKEDLLIINFDYGFYFNLQNIELYDKENNLIHLTKTETRFILYLIKNKQKFISLNELKKGVWGKDATIYTIRNIPNRIRKKTYKGIIMNQSSEGYYLDIKKERKIK